MRLTALTQALHNKGYKMSEFAEIVGLSRTHCHAIARNPKPIHWLAVKGLDDRRKKPKPVAIILNEFDPTDPEVQKVFQILSHRAF